jgi:CTP:molybdopterin cytidylyltransferase MocA
VRAAPANGERKAEVALSFTAPVGETSGPPMLCAVRGIGRTLDFALQEARETDRPLYLLFVREQPILTPEDRRRKWVDDEEAKAIFSYAKGKAEGHTLLPCYAVSDSAADTIVDIAATVGASYLILGAPERNMLVNLLRGNIIRNISSILPEEIHLLVYA